MIIYIDMLLYYVILFICLLLKCDNNSYSNVVTKSELIHLRFFSLFSFALINDKKHVWILIFRLNTSLYSSTVLVTGLSPYAYNMTICGGWVNTTIIIFKILPFLWGFCCAYNIHVSNVRAMKWVTLYINFVINKKKHIKILIFRLNINTYVCIAVQFWFRDYH